MNCLLNLLIVTPKRQNKQQGQTFDALSGQLIGSLIDQLSDELVNQVIDQLSAPVVD